MLERECARLWAWACVCVCISAWMLGTSPDVKRQRGWDVCRHKCRFYRFFSGYGCMFIGRMSAYGFMLTSWTLLLIKIYACMPTAHQKLLSSPDTHTQTNITVRIVWSNCQLSSIFVLQHFSISLCLSFYLSSLLRHQHANLLYLNIYVCT